MSGDAVQGWRQGAQGWVANEAIFDATLAPVTAALVQRAGWSRGQRWLDVGCGTGTMLLEGTSARAELVGIDVSPAMVEAARSRVPGATVIEADAQGVDVAATVPGPQFDGVISRFGVMFFEDPTAAFANLRSVTAPGGALVFACWRAREENPVFTLGMDLLTSQLSDPLPVPPPRAPGPTAFADADHLRGLLGDSGWADVTIEPFDFTCDYGMAGSDGVEERLSVILATASGRFAQQQLEPVIGAERWAELLEDVRAELRRHRVDGVLRLPAATWLVVAGNH